MKIAKDRKIELIASQDKTRFILQEPYLKGDYLVATSGRHLVRLKIEREEGDTDGYVTAAAIKAARKTGYKNDAASIACNGAYKLVDGTTLPRNAALTESQFPNFEQVIPKEPGPVKVSLNAKMLWEMAQAMGSDTLTLAIKDELSPLVVTCKNEDALGVLMPVRMA